MLISGRPALAQPRIPPDITCTEVKPHALVRTFQAKTEALDERGVKRRVRRELCACYCFVSCRSFLLIRRRALLCLCFYSDTIKGVACLDLCSAPATLSHLPVRARDQYSLTLRALVVLEWLWVRCTCISGLLHRAEWEGDGASYQGEGAPIYYMG